MVSQISHRLHSYFNQIIQFVHLIFSPGHSVLHMICSTRDFPLSLFELLNFLFSTSFNFFINISLSLINSIFISWNISFFHSSVYVVLESIQEISHVVLELIHHKFIHVLPILWAYFLSFLLNFCLQLCLNCSRWCCCYWIGDLGKRHVQLAFHVTCFQWDLPIWS